MKESYTEYRERTIYGQDTSERYARRKLEHRGEFDLVDRAMALVPDNLNLLDVPCGGGRFSVHLSQQGYTVTAGDRSEDMRRITKSALEEAGFPGNVMVQDIESMSGEPRSFDAIFCFRLFHHFPHKDIRAKAIGELCRIADQYVVMSYFNSRCLNMVRRRVRDRLKGKLYKKYGTPISEVKEYFANNDFELVADFPERRWLRPLHIAVFRRTTGTA